MIQNHLTVTFWKTIFGSLIHKLFMLMMAPTNQLHTDFKRKFYFNRQTFFLSYLFRGDLWLNSILVFSSRPIFPPSNFYSWHEDNSLWRHLLNLFNEIPAQKRGLTSPYYTTWIRSKTLPSMFDVGSKTWSSSNFVTTSGHFFVLLHVFSQSWADISCAKKTNTMPKDADCCFS